MLKKFKEILGINKEPEQFEPKAVETKIIEFEKLKDDLQSKLMISNKIVFFKLLKNLFGFSGIYTEDYEDNHLSRQYREDSQREIYYDITKALELIRKFGGRDGQVVEKRKIRGDKITNTVDISELRYDYFFKIDKVFIQNNYYIFISVDGNGYRAKVNDFNTNGIESKSLAYGGVINYNRDDRLSVFGVEKGPGGISLVKEGKTISTIVGEDIVVISQKRGKAIVINNNFIQYISVDRKGVIQKGDSIKHKYGKIKSIRKDNHVNFLFFISEHDGEKSKLHIVNRKNLEEVKTFEDIEKIVAIDNLNNLSCINSSGENIGINTNLLEFPVGFVNTSEVAELRIVEVRSENAKTVGKVLDHDDKGEIEGKGEQIRIMANKLERDLNAVIENLGEEMYLAAGGEMKARQQKTPMKTLIFFQQETNELENEKSKIDIDDKEINDTIERLKEMISVELMKYERR